MGYQNFPFHFDEITRYGIFLLITACAALLKLEYHEIRFIFGLCSFVIRWFEFFIDYMENQLPDAKLDLRVN